MIKFVNDIEKDRLRMAYNNDTLRFYSNSPKAVRYADVACIEDLLVIEGENPAEYFSARLYPNPTGQFYINLQPYVAALLNTRNFEDTLKPNLIAASTSSFTYPFSAGTFFAATVKITVYFEDGTYEIASNPLAWLAGVQQIERNALTVLSPTLKNNGYESYLKYWQGYPFDFGMLYYTGIAFFRNFTVANETNLLSATLPHRGAVTRMVLSDGNTDESLETVLPLNEGINKLKITITSKEKWLTLEKVPYRNGVYLKWLNAFGCYSYWLFEDTYAIDRSTKYTGEMAAGNANLSESTTRTLQLGKETQDSMRIIAELLTEEERRIVEGILDSPKIYLFTGQPFAKNSNTDWVEVTLKTSSARIRNPKQPLTNFTFDIELPVRYGQTL